MSYDRVLTGGTVIDGTGRAGEILDVGITGDTITALRPPGTLAGSAATVDDVTGLVVSPGFVDLHTHYDAQLLWDPTASPSPLHGVTSLFGGNCGFGLAPVESEDIDYLTRLMAKVEGIPLEALEAGVDWEWRRFDEYLDRIDGSVAVNAGFLCGHSPIRRAVMGAESVERPATDREIVSMQEALAEALGAGAIGFSTSQAHTHRDGNGDPVPSRLADRDELLLLAEVCGRFPGTQVEVIVPGCINGFSADEIELLTDLSLRSDRPVNWNVLAVTSLNPTGHVPQLQASTEAADRGALVRALTIPQGFQIRINFQSGMPLDAMPEWGPVMALPRAERLVALADPEVRRRLDEGSKHPDAGLIAALANWEILRFFECHTEETKRYEGRSVGEVARETGREPFDCLLDTVVTDQLRTVVQPPIPAETDEGWQLRAAAWRDDRTIVGGSDAGAHLDMFCGAMYTTVLIGEAARDRQLLSLEEAVHQLSDVPARFYGLTGRGRVAEGWKADLVVFDPQTVNAQREKTIDDLPGGASRLTAGADGFHQVMVNGRTIVVDGQFTGATPGTVLRSGTDTETVPITGSSLSTSNTGAAP